jgi:hypothetical protein
VLTAKPDAGEAAFSASSIDLAGRGKVKLMFDGAGEAAIAGFQLASVPGGPETEERVRGWKVLDGDGKYIGSLVRNQQGIGVNSDIGLAVIIR